MNPKKFITNWIESSVDKSKPYFELRYDSHSNVLYGSEPKNSCDDGLPVALVSEPGNEIMNVEILLDKNKSENKAIIERVINDIKFYLIDKKEPDPWGYAIYHCGTASNVYSNIHWSYFDPEQEDVV